MIAITSTGKSKNSLVDLRFARCPYFCIVEQDNYRFVVNPFTQEENNVAPMVIDWLSNQGIDKIITGEIGSIAKNNLEEKKIQVILLNEEKINIGGILKKLA